MPDILMHYLVSYLVASRVVRRRYAVFIALAGLLPDLDVLSGIHRWVTHSLVPLFAIASVAAVILFYVRRYYLKYLTLISLLYALHLALDFLVGPTPLLWPLTDQAYMLRIELNGEVSVGGVSLMPQVALIAEPADFTPRPIIKGSLISSTSVLLLVVVVVVTVVEVLKERLSFGRQ